VAVVDDGRKPSLLGSLFRKVAAPPAKKAVPPTIPQQDEELEPVPLVRDSLVEFQASLPEKLDVDREAFAQFLLNLSLCREFMLPLQSGKIDPFIGLVGALSELQPGELGLFQVLWQPVQNRWAESIVNSVTHEDGKPFFINQPELTGAAEHKIASPLFAAVVRILVRAGDFDRLLQLGRDMAGSLRVFAHPNGNELIPLQNDDYPLAEHIEDVLRRQTRRTGMLLNADELIGFVHLPGSAVRSRLCPADRQNQTSTGDSAAEQGPVAWQQRAHRRNR